MVTDNTISEHESHARRVSFKDRAQGNPLH